MKYIDLTLPTPAANLACDEALLDFCDSGDGGEFLRFWEAPAPFVVIGYANQMEREVRVAACRTQGIPILRRCSGGGTVLQGPGCLNYSLILKIPETGPLSSVSGTNTCILKRHQAALAPLVKGHIRVQGHTDLTLDELKFSGNAQRRRRNFLIFHGTFLLNFDIASIQKFLPMPSLQPDYRRARPHCDFMVNLNLSPDAVKLALRQIWHAEESAADLTLANLPDMMQKYSSDKWNFRF